MPLTLLAILLHADAPESAGCRALELLGCRGPQPNWRRHDDCLLTVQLASTPEDELLERLRRVPGVRDVLDRTPTAVRPDPHTVAVGQIEFGGPRVPIIAGPCSVESERALFATADVVADAGADALRGGAFKPRSSPYSFGGLGLPGLEILARARERTGLPVVTEVLEPADVTLVARHADLLQIGARNMHNFPLLFAAGRCANGVPVLLKRGIAATIEELLLAAEYVRLGRLAAGHDEHGVILCERGVRGFEPSTRFQLDVAAFPLVHGRSNLPILADPSHAAGHRELVPALAAAAVAAGADGLLLEVHHDPESAWTDAEQTIGPPELRQLVREVRAIAALRRQPEPLRQLHGAAGKSA